MSPASYRTAPPRGDISYFTARPPRSPPRAHPTWAMPRSQPVHLLERRKARPVPAGCRRRAGGLGAMVACRSAPSPVGVRDRDAVPAELLARLDGPVESVGGPLLSVTVGGPVTALHRLRGVGDRGIHVRQRLVETLLGGAVRSGRSLALLAVGRSVLALLAIGRSVLALVALLALVDAAFPGLGAGRPGGRIGVRHL